MKLELRKAVRFPAYFCRNFLLLLLVGGLVNLNAQTATQTILIAKGKVKISATGPCERIISLNNGTVIVPVETVAFTYKDGQYVEVAYEILKDRVISCKEGPAAKITKIAEIVVTPEVCKIPISITKNSTTPVSYTFKTGPQPEGSRYYWYFGDNGASDAASPSHTYTTGGTYTVNLKVLDKTGKVCYGEMKETFLGGTATTTTHTAKGKVKILAGSICEKMIVLDNNTIIVPVESVAFNYKDGQYVEMAYEILKDRVISCKEGPAAKITKIAEIMVTPEVCKIPISITKNSTTPVSYTFKTGPQPEGSRYYWYFGDHGTSDAASPTHTFAASGTYLVNLKVLDKSGKVCYGEMKAEFLGGTVTPTPTILTAKGKVKLSSAPCERIITLDNGTVIVPVETVAFTYKDGQYVELAYQILKDRVINCKAGPAAKISKISEIFVTPSACHAAVITSIGELTANSARINFKLPADAKAAVLQLMATGSNNWVSFPITSLTAIYFDLKELKAGTKYYYHLKTECATGSAVTADAYFETKATTVCAPASGVTVSEITASSARISYKLPPAFKDVAVQIRDANTNDWITIGIANLSSTYFDKRELKAGTKYVVKIKTVCTDGSINYSPEVLFATLVSTACPAAIITSIGELTATSARINFKLPADAKAAVLQLMATGSNNWVSFPITSLTAIYFDLKELQAGTKYYYHLKTECATGSAVTADAHFETKAAVVCAAASNVTVGELTANSARINYKLPADVKAAAVEIREATANNWLSIPITSLTATYFDKKELKAATKYYYHVKTVCANGSVNYSPDAYFLTAAATPIAGICTAATGLSVTSIGPNGVKIIYILPTGISSATLEVINANTTNTDASAWLSKNILIPSTYTERGDLLPATKYKFRIKTVCANGGAVMYSALGDFTTTASKTVAPSCAAYNVSVSEITTSGARINYKLPAEIITASLEIIASNTSVWLSFPIDNNSTYFLLSPLDPSTGYYYRIKTVCSDGTFNFTPNAKFTTKGYKSGEITDAASSAQNSNELTVSCFPNPATNSISVNIMGDSDQLVDVKLSTIYGHVVFESKFSNNVVHEINVKNYPKGIYVLRVSKSGKTSSVKIVIN